MTATASPDSAPTHDNANPDGSTSTTHNAPQMIPDSATVLSDSSSLSDIKPDDENSLDFSPVKLETNGYHPDESGSNTANGTENHDDERPSKRRRVRDTSPHNTPRRPKPVSPPWKKIEADGPTTFIEDGRRRSGRTNALPLDLQPHSSKRMTRGTLHGLQSASSSESRRTSGRATPNGSTKHASTGKGHHSRAQTLTAKPSTRKSLSNSTPTRTSPRGQKRSVSPPPASKLRSLRTRRSSRNLRESLDSQAQDPEPSTLESPNSRLTRIKLRLKPPPIPIIHPLQVGVFPGKTLPRAKIASNFEEFVQRAPTINVEDGGWLDPADESAPYTEETARREASIIVRIEDEAQPGGLLSAERSTLFVPEPEEEPSRQWAHMDHLVKQMANFRKLMLMEQQRHRATAKRLAEACKEEWLRRQPKSAEQIEWETRLSWMGHYKTVMKAFAGTWENVKTELNRRRVEEWEAAEQKRVKAALNEAVNKSELQLQARRAHLGSEAISEDEDELDESNEEADDENEDINSDDESISEDESDEDDEDNMSSSDDDEDAKSDVSDEALTQDQLRAKYADVPKLSPSKRLPNGDGGPTEVVDGHSFSGHDNMSHSIDQGETTDESVDMDDDLGSSDEGSDNNEGVEASDDGDDSDEDEEPSGLLGLLFGKKELKQMTDDAAADQSQELKDVEMADASDIALSQDAEETTVNGLDMPVPAGGAHTESGRIAELIPSQRLGSQTPPAGTAPAPATKSPALAVRIPSDASLANEAQISTAKLEPLQAQEVEMELVDVVENVPAGSDIHNANETRGQEEPTVPSLEVTVVASDNIQTSPDTDAVTKSPSRDHSQSPRTSDTKPSDMETSSSIIMSGVGRSASPQALVPTTEVPFLLRGTLREYQHYGLDWLAGLYRNQTNGILADEMGLGKTIQTISLLAHLACHHEVWGPHLVIVPTSVMLNWEMEFKKWCPGFKVLSYYGSIEERRRKRQGWKTDDIWNVCITSYQIVLQDQQVFKRRRWHYMILDEAHNIKNFKSKRWQTLLTFNTRARLLLTGTPLQNNLTELWSLLFFLMPSENGVGGFADLAEFQDWFHKPESQILESGREQMDDEARAIIAKLHKVLRPYLLRRLKADVEKQMPAKYEHVEFCRLSRRQRELYDGFLARTDTREALSSGNYISVINCLMQLRKVCNHPDLFVERPIMTSFRQQKSVVAGFENMEHLVRGKLMAEDPMRVVSLGFLNLIPTQHEDKSITVCDRLSQLSSHGILMDLGEAQRARAQVASANLDPSTVHSNLSYMESAARWGRFQELQHCVYLNAIRRHQRPIYGKQLRDFLTLGLDRRPSKPRPRIPQQIMSWFEEESPVLKSMVPTLDERAAALKTTISKFACVTPAVITRDIDQFVLGSRGVDAFSEMDLKLSAPVRYSPFMPKEPPVDPWHEARMRLSIQFPDKRLLQYDCGKLQALDRLLRKLQSGGHRALIFTQMTKVLDILEQFLNIHGHKYLRLDGATKVEQRQILTDRFNHDTRILCFILSTRSGGLGINLTGADTVIFYDQDWNPAMDKQCQDRCHRIGQTRDVHIYRLVSEHTIEANILRKASQKQMLDDVVIQEGGFTTDYFNKLSVHEVIGRPTEEADVVGDAMDRVLGGVENSDQRTVNRVLEQAEDREDIDAARVAEKEIQEDEADFEEKPTTANASGASSTRQGTPTTRDGSVLPGVGRSNLGLHGESADVDDALEEMENNAWGERIRTIDEYMLSTMSKQLEGTALELPRDKKKSKSKKGKDTRKR
ncbi:SNF2 family domain-containing protein [Xylariomycetidae sp. FL2044]|nr:SNF2 family domain-containing protein [Xylariomycetidae sp. FL2044]